MNSHEETAFGPIPTPIPATRPKGFSPKRLDPKTARARREQREQGFTFTLRDTVDETGMPTTAWARLPQIFDADSLAGLPQTLRVEIFKLVESVEAGGGAADPQAAISALSSADIVAQFGSITHVVDAYCLIGFIEPRVFATPEEADAKGGVWVRDIEFSDRMRFFEFCSERERTGAATALPFSHGRPAPAVGAGPVDPALSGVGQPEPSVAPDRPADPHRPD